MPHRRRQSVLAALSAVAVILGVGVGCSNSVDQPRVAPMPTTTDPNLAADMMRTPPPLPAAEIVRGLDSAVSASDFCAVLSAIDVAEPDSSDAAGATDVYRALAAATAATRPFVPRELRTPWEVVVEATDAAATAVADHDGDVHDPDVEVALTSTAVTRALDSVERYQMTECPAPVVPG